MSSQLYQATREFAFRMLTLGRIWSSTSGTAYQLPFMLETYSMGVYRVVCSNNLSTGILENIKQTYPIPNETATRTFSWILWLRELLLSGYSGTDTGSHLQTLEGGGFIPRA